MKLHNYEDITENIIGIPTNVRTGYRLNYSKWETVKSIFQIHNETVNIWTHIWLFFNVLYLFNNLNDISRLQLDNFFDRHQFILFTTYSSSLVASFCSAWSHTFYMVELEYIKYPWLVDFVGITFAIYFSGVGSIWYVFHSPYKYLYILFTTYQYYKNVNRGITRHIMLTNTNKFRNNLREFRETFIYCALYGWIVPWYYGYLTGNVSESRLFSHLSISIVYFFIGAIFLDFHFPQKMFPNRFDIIGHSHQIWHMFVNLAVCNFCRISSKFFSLKNTN